MISFSEAVFSAQLLIGFWLAGAILVLINLGFRFWHFTPPSSSRTSYPILYLLAVAFFALPFPVLYWSSHRSLDSAHNASSGDVHGSVLTPPEIPANLRPLFVEVNKDIAIFDNGNAVNNYGQRIQYLSEGGPCAVSYEVTKTKFGKDETPTNDGFLAIELDVPRPSPTDLACGMRTRFASHPFSYTDMSKFQGIQFDVRYRPTSGAPPSFYVRLEQPDKVHERLFNATREFSKIRVSFVDFVPTAAQRVAVTSISIFARGKDIHGTLDVHNIQLW